MPAGNPDIEAAVNGDKGALRRVLSAHDDLHQQTFRRLGVNAHGKKQDGATPLPTPATGTIAVTGVDGRFLVTITPALPNFNRIAGQMPRFNNPRKGDNFRDDDARVGRKQNLRMANDVRRAGRLVHELQSATSSLWDNNSNVTTYGPSDKVTYDITDPNATKLWRFRSKFEDSDYTDYVYFVDPSTCGPMPVWSGLPRTSSTAQNNSTGINTGSNPLTQSGTTTRINAASSTWKFGNQILSYNSGFVDPGSYGTFYVYVKDAKKVGGTVTYLTTTLISDISSADDILQVGKITTSAGGGGTGGGGGTCVVGETLITMADGSTRAMQDLRRGDLIMGLDGGAERIELIELIPKMPCFDFATATGLTLRCSSTHPLRLQGGQFPASFDIYQGDVVQTAKGYDGVASKKFAGNFTVYRMKLSRTQTYIANGFVSHNLKP